MTTTNAPRCSCSFPFISQCFMWHPILWIFREYLAMTMATWGGNNSLRPLLVKNAVLNMQEFRWWLLSFINLTTIGQFLVFRTSVFATIQFSCWTGTIIPDMLVVQFQTMIESLRCCSFKSLYSDDLKYSDTVQLRLPTLIVLLEIRWTQ